MEAKLRPVFDRLLVDEYISQAELSLLLDWFDKTELGFG